MKTCYECREKPAENFDLCFDCELEALESFAGQINKLTKSKVVSKYVEPRKKLRVEEERN